MSEGGVLLGLGMGVIVGEMGESGMGFVDRVMGGG